MTELTACPIFHASVIQLQNIQA